VLVVWSIFLFFFEKIGPKRKMTAISWLLEQMMAPRRMIDDAALFSFSNFLTCFSLEARPRRRALRPVGPLPLTVPDERCFRAWILRGRRCRAAPGDRFASQHAARDEGNVGMRYATR